MCWKAWEDPSRSPGARSTSGSPKEQGRKLAPYLLSSALQGRVDSHVLLALLVGFMLLVLSPSSLVGSSACAILIVPSAHKSSVSPSANSACQFVACRLSLYPDSELPGEGIRMAQATRWVGSPGVSLTCPIGFVHRPTTGQY